MIVVGRGQQATPFIKDMTVSREHCHLTPNGDGTFILEDKSDGRTFVNGNPIFRTTVKLDDTIQLGEKCMYKVSQLVQGATPPPPPPPSAEYSLKPLEVVWNNYRKDKIALSKKSSRVGLLVRVPMLLSAISGVLAGVLPQEFRIITIVLAIVGLCVMIYGFIQQKNFVMAEEVEKLDSKFQDQYICPNPGCHRFLGNIRYIDLRKEKKCRHCGCKYTDK